MLATSELDDPAFEVQDQPVAAFSGHGGAPKQKVLVVLWLIPSSEHCPAAPDSEGLAERRAVPSLT